MLCGESCLLQNGRFFAGETVWDCLYMLVVYMNLSVFLCLLSLILYNVLSGLILYSHTV